MAASLRASPRVTGLHIGARVDPDVGEVRGNYKQKLGLAGDLHVTVTPEGPNTRIYVRVSAIVDGLHARLRRPTTRLLEKFREGLADDTDDDGYDR